MNADLHAILVEVGTSMESVGLRLDRHVSLRLGTPQSLGRAGLFDGTPHQLGVTSYSTDTRRNVVGAMAIGIVEGLPQDLFRLVLVHEYGHGYLIRGGRIPAAPQVAQEGFCEALACDYLRRHRPSARATRMADSLMANPDPIYGDGLRLMLPAVKRFGFPAVARAVISGDLRSVGVGTERIYGSRRPPRRRQPTWA